MDKKIIIVSQFFSPDYAPTGQLLNSLSNRLNKFNLKFKVICGMPFYAYKKNYFSRYEVVKNKIIIRTRISTFFKKNFIGKFLNGFFFCLNAIYNLIFIHPESDLIIFTTEPPFSSLIALVVSSLKNIKFLFIIYDSYPNVLIENGYFNENNLLIKIWFSLNKYVYSKAQRIITLSPPMYKRFLVDYPNTTKKLTVISSWADVNKIKPISKNKNWFIKKYKLEDKFVVLYSGNQGRCHDIETILDTSFLLRSEKNILFVFIGSGYKNKLIRDFKYSNNLTNIMLLPYQDFEDLSFSLTSADIAVVSISEKSDSLIAPSKLYGHLAAGTPIALISPPNSYLEELVNIKQVGETFLNGNSQSLKEWIIKLRNDKDLKNYYAFKSRKYIVKECSEEVITKEYYELIRKILKI